MSLPTIAGVADGQRRLAAHIPEGQRHHDSGAVGRAGALPAGGGARPPGGEEAGWPT